MDDALSRYQCGDNLPRSDAALESPKVMCNVMMLKYPSSDKDNQLVAEANTNGCAVRKVTE